MSIFNHGNTGPIGANAYGSQKEAIMYLFSPQFMPPMDIRPPQYAFDMHFCESVERIVDSATTESTQSLAGNYSPMGQEYNQAINRAIKPSMNSIHFDTNILIDRLWTFLLILDNAPLIGRYAESSMRNRIIYTGVIIDAEPCSNLMGKLTLNPNAMCMITHRTYLQIRNISGPTGYIQRPVIQTDEDILVPQTILQMNNDRGYLLTPHSLATSHVRDGFDNILDSPAMAHIQNSRSNLQLDTDAGNPHKQVRSIINGLTKMRVFSANDTDFRSDFRAVPTIVRDAETERQLFTDQLTSTPSLQVPGLPINASITLGRILNDYPGLHHKTHVMNVPFQVPAEMMDTRAPNPTNIWTSLIQSTVPSILSYYGICELSMRFCSHNPVASSRLDNAPIWEVQDIGTYVQADNDNLKARWEYVLRALETQVFGIIKDNCGEFDVTISFNANNYCAVQLQLLDMMEVPETGYAVHHGVALPFATPLLGTDMNRHHNATAMEDLITFTANSIPQAFPNLNHY